MQVKQTLYQSVLWRGIYYLSAFMVNVLIARHFEAAVSGNIYYISSLYALILLALSFSIESGITFFAAKKQIAAGKLFSFSLTWSLVSGLTCFAFVYFFSGNSFAGIGRPLLLLSSACFICGNLLSTYCTGLFYANNDFLAPNLVSTLINIILVVLLPYKGSAVVPGITDASYFTIYFISFLLQGIIMAATAWIKYIHKLSFSFLSRNEFGLLFRYCAMAYLANIIFFLLYRIDYWFVERYCSAGQLGNYIQVSKLAQLFFILPTILASAVFPLTAGGQQLAVNRLLAIVSRMLLLLYTAGCIFLLLTGKWLFPFVFGKSFSGMYMPFLLLIPGILSLSGLFTLTAYYAGKDRIKVNITGSLLALGVIIIGDSIFIPAYGINAAALISSAGYIVYQLYVLLVFKKEYGAVISDFFIFKISDWRDISNIIGQAVKKER